MAKIGKKRVVSQEKKWGYRARANMTKSPPVKAVILYKIAVTLMTSRARRSYRRSPFLFPSHSQVTAKMGAPNIKAAKRMCS